MITFPSKKEWDLNKPKFPLLPAEDYILQVVKVEPGTKQKYMSTEMIDVMKVVLEVVSYKDGEPVYDIDGGKAAGRKMFLDLNPESMGFTQAGDPSKTRQLLAYSMGLDPFEEIEFESWDWLLVDTFPNLLS